MSRSDIIAGRAYVELALQDAEYMKGLQRARQRMLSFGSGMMAIGASTMKAGAAIVGTLLAATAHFVKSGDALGDMSDRTGIAASKLAELSYAAKLSETDMDSLEKALHKMAVAIQHLRDGGSEAESMFRKLGLAAADFAGKSPDEQFELIAERLKDVHDVTKRTAIAQSIFGKMGPALVPLMKNLKRLREEARREGLIPSDEAVQAAGDIDDAMGRVKQTVHAAWFELGHAFAPAVLDALGSVRRIIKYSKDWVQQNQAALRTVGKLGVATFMAGAALYFAGNGIMFTTKSLEGLQKLSGMASAALMLPVRSALALGTALSPVTKLMNTAGKIGSRALAGVAAWGKRMGQNVAAGSRLAASGIQTVLSAAGSLASTAVTAGTRAGAALARTIASGASQASRAIVAIGAGAARLPGLIAAGAAASKGPLAALGRELLYIIRRPADYARALAPQLVATLGQAFNRILSIGGQGAGRLRAAWSAMVDALSTRFRALASQAGSVWDSIASAARARLMPVWNVIASASGAAAAKIGALWAPIAARIRGPLSRLAPLVQQDWAKLVGYASTIGRGIVAGFNFVGPRVARGMVTAMQAGFTRILSMGRTTAAGLARTMSAGLGMMGRGAGGALGGIGMLASLAGPLLGSMGTLLTMLPLIASGVASLVNPFTLVAGAIAGGLYLWTQYSETGKAALDKVMAILAPFLETFKITFAGIKDAISAGDLGLAAEIALAGLRVAFLQGIQLLSTAVGGKLGQFMGKIGAQLAGGDLQGAWDTAIAGMAAVWANFTEGLVAVFGQAIDWLTTKWESWTKKITDWILESSAEGGILGALGLAGTGVSVKDEQAKGNKLNQEEVAIKQQQLARARQDLATAQANGGSQTDANGDTWTAEDIQRQIDELEADLGSLAAGPDVLKDAKGIAHGQLGGMADSARAWLDELNRGRQQNTRDAESALGTATEGGQQEADAALEKAKQDLLDKRAQAARAKEAKDREEAEARARADETAGKIPSDQDVSSKVAGTFSAAAAEALGGGGTVQDRIAKAAEETAKEVRDHKKETQRLTRILESRGKTR